MSIHIALRHLTTYNYDRPIALSPQTIRLRPAPHCRTAIESYGLTIRPATHFVNWQQDPHGNFQARVVFPERTRTLEIEVELVADMTVINPFDFFLEPEAEHYPFTYDPILEQSLAPFRKCETPGPGLRAWLAGVDRSKRLMNDFLVDLNRQLQREIDYVVRMEFGVQTPEETLSLKSGSCRDSGWLLVQILRHLGFAARFASGYLIQLAADRKPIEGAAGPSRDFTDLHAWTEVYLPGSGWIGLDPTSGMLAAEGHIPLACTPEPPSAAPITGLLEPAQVDFRFDMTVERIRETPRVTKPYSEAQWARIEALGDVVDRDLIEHDVRLTMGGEPTFVSVDDMEGPEWNIAALGDDKRERADRLFRRLADRFAPGGLLHYGQGKWYPGEPLPRWALSCFWRNDGEPVWRDRSLLVDPGGKEHGDATIETAERFIAALGKRLSVDGGFIHPAYEDTWYYLWREKRLPVNVRADENKLEDPLERVRLARLLDGALGAPVGYVLPLAPREAGEDPDKAAARPPAWRSGPWYFRDDTLLLVAGDSPMGLRLPLDTLPWQALDDRSFDHPLDPSAPRDELPPRRALDGAAPPDTADVADLADPVDPASHVKRPPAVGESAKDLVRTALCVEPRAGWIHVFMPPLTRADDYLALIAAVEGVAGALAQRVVIEGYVPDYDPRIESFSVTPDPGVIEVNIHPSRSWRELVERTEAVYELARDTRLGAEKFMLDGRHTGTGGGNHIVLGGTTATDSPLLRRPDLLRSLLAYWNNHPSLSYLFSGTFIGPTSQHPRVDEARNDALYELEIAFQQIPESDDVSPWLVDRLFRHLLVDVTGNTHRAEFCIDKLYAPESASGRRGLLELRAFEMPPHGRMSLAQQLLLRALVARFWRQPNRRGLVRWGTRLHDEFMLPHFIWRDFAAVIDDLRDAGYDFDLAWFAPHLAFRFPAIGSVTYHGVTLELRHGLEPWHVLGEQAVAGGTSRGVDSSVERLQIRVTGTAGSRYVITCNGRALPLSPTGVEGEAVAGLRYRAWQPPTALHPTIGVHTPLLFDVWDSWNETSLGGCTYHVAHPGGRNFETFPVNANEAEARRRARFSAMGHMPANTSPTAEPANPEHPLTLDLRYSV